MKYIICSFFGDGSTNYTDEMYIRVKRAVEKLIAEDGVNVFLFAGHIGFELLCLKAVSELKNTYPHIRRLYVRDEHKYIDYKLKEFVARNFDDTFCPFESSVKRNYYMIDNSEHCVFGSKTASDTKTAYEYALKRKRHIVDLVLKLFIFP